jgi:dihydrofolate synthase / folylpolyglutamate synthase
VDVALSDYRAALDYLFARTTGKTKFGLERTRALLHTLGDPHDRLRVLHVAGTNGKGSVCATLETLLRARGLRVGKYTSPHLVDFRERVVVDGVPVEEDEVVAWVERWTPACERLGATFFEATTALAFDYFARSGIDVAVVETGLGGRLDSTNVVTPLAAGVASIGIDHVEFLGETREEIAAEKAGIFKPGCPAVIGERELAIRRLLAKLARGLGADPVRVVAEEGEIADVVVSAEGTSFTAVRGGERFTLHTPLAGRHQAGNAMLALTMLEAAGTAYAVPLVEADALLEGVRVPGRFHRAGKFIFDVAHNPDGAAVVAETLRLIGTARPVVALLTVLADKDWRGVMSALAPAIDQFVLSASPTAPASRAWQPEEARAFATARGWPARVERDFDRALALAEQEGETVLVTGSFHTVGDAMTRLQVSPLAG